MTARTRQVAATLVVCFGVLAIADHLRAAAAPVVEAGPQSLPASQQEALESHAGASLFGQFRSGIADFLWIKVEKYLHNGVDLRGLTEVEKQAGAAQRVRSADGKESGNRQHDGSETTVVPNRAADWRGVLGDVERQTQPFADMTHHTHRDPKEALPLFRLMTWSNPHFVLGYTTGAVMIARDRRHTEEALAFLEEGARNNPESLGIATCLGWLLTTRAKRYDDALPHLRRAIALGERLDPRTASEDDVENYQDAYRWLVNNRASANDPAGARAAALAGLRVFPKDVSCRTYLQRHPAP